MVKAQLQAAVKEALIAIGAPEARFVVERPADLAHGDYATNAALAAAKILKKNPRDVAVELIAKLSYRSPFAEGVGVHVQKVSLPVDKIDVAGAGFINFTLSRETLTQTVMDAANSPQWGSNEVYADKTIMVEYTDPNPFKEFHIGHLMSNAIGESIARLYRYSGATVVRANYQGDVGPHVAKALFILLEKGIDDPTIAQIGAAYVEGASRYEANPTDKAAIDQLNKVIYEKSDERVQAVYEKGRALSLEHFEEIYQKLGTTFDLYFFESETGPIGLETVGKRSDVFKQSDGATVFKGEEFGLHTRVFVTSQGLPTYEAKEIGLVQLKRERCAADEYLTITASEQNGFFAVVFKAVELLFPDLHGRLTHRSHGMMRIASGKMSSRTGNVVTGESLLSDLISSAQDKMSERNLEDGNKIAEQVAVGAIKYAVLRQGSARDIIFDPEKSLSLEGDSGPYLQYAHTRANSLLGEAAKAGVYADIVDAPSEPLQIERILAHFPDVVAHAASEREPHYLATYLTELAASFNSWYANNRVIGGAYPSYGLLLTQAFEKTMSIGLDALGIPVPERM